MTVPDLIPARMLNESVYCERLFYLMWVSQLFEPNAWTAAGSAVHSRVDSPRTRGDPEHPEAVTALTLTSDRLGLVAKLDLVEFDGTRAVPIDYKVGKPAPTETGVWDPERIQICAQALLLREAGYECSRGAVWFNGARRRVEVEITEELVRETMYAIDQAEKVAQRSTPPPPLIDSPKCAPCAVVGLCLPYETNLLAGRQPQRKSRLMVPDWPGRPLYLTEPGSRLGVTRKTLEVRKDRETVSSIRLIDVDQVCVFGKGVQITTQAVHELMSHDIPLLYFSGGGWFKGLANGLPGKHVELRRRQVVLASTEALRFSRAFVEGKIRNSRTLLRRHAASDDVSYELKQLDGLASRAAKSDDSGELLGIEGMAAKHYFSRFVSMIEPENRELFSFDRRSRRPPRDPTNAVLSFLYSLLTKELTVAALAVGFDPYQGFFHRPRFGRPALALDVAEEFRPLVADSTFLMLVNNGELRNGHFVSNRHGTGLTREGRQRVIKAFERRLEVETKHHVFGYRVTYRRLLHLQMRLLARVMVGDMDGYSPFVTR